MIDEARKRRFLYSIGKTVTQAVLRFTTLGHRDQAWTSTLLPMSGAALALLTTMSYTPTTTGPSQSMSEMKRIFVPCSWSSIFNDLLALTKAHMFSFFI